MHLPKSDNKAADALSRAHVVSALEVGEEARQHQLRGWEEIREAADQDPEYVRERGEVEQGLPHRGKEVRQGVIIDQVDRILVPRGAALRRETGIGGPRAALLWALRSQANPGSRFQELLVAGTPW